MSEPFYVVIIGGGIGGLTLAQGLKRAGVSAAVYERDRTLTNRLQAYRVHIGPTGGLALHQSIHDYETGARLRFSCRAQFAKGNAPDRHRRLPALLLSRLTLRAINALPPVKQIVARRLGEE